MSDKAIAKPLPPADAVEAEARARGVQLAGMAAEDGLRGETMAKVYRRRGYAISERMFWKGL